ncbi:hypothetical protein GUJ93_ZPchr0001g30970 [Zizania palustris]|uniref:Uncharacterized protein n=1 Tax=Zizania palustris TaxID=103762 RepID=A0A8J5S7M5_ZIZPA|nr:hypothetical protein GUJ93_ZPchr0001g30970 [Zizania palustris]
MAIVGGGGSADVFSAYAVAAAVAVMLLFLGGAVAAAAAAAGGGGGGAEAVGRPCFHACFDQCVQREEFWFCQFSCYRRCGAVAVAVSGSFGGDCEHACVLSMCGQIDPDSKMMAVCRDTCGKSYAADGCPPPTRRTAAA